MPNKDKNDDLEPLKETSNVTCLPRRQGKRSAEADLDILDVMDKEGDEKEQTEQDLAHIAHLEADLERAKRLGLQFESDLQDARADARAIMNENGSIKRLFAAIGVNRDDFNVDGLSEPDRKRRMLSTGRRLMHNLNTNARLGLAGTATVLAPHQSAVEGDTPGPPAPSQYAKPAFTPPASFPVESQIAAAALTLAHGDPAAALLSLLEKALASRAPQQQNAADASNDDNDNIKNNGAPQSAAVAVGGH